MSLRSIVTGSILGLFWAVSASADQGAKPLDAAALKHCSNELIQMREASERLNARNAEYAQRRETLNRQRQNISDSAEVRRRYNAAAEAFNAEMARFQEELTKINAVRQSYDRDCAGRPYRTSDFDALSPEQQRAMRRGTDDITVPFDARGLQRD